MRRFLILMCLLFLVLPVAINLAGSEGLVPRHSVPQGGQYLYCDTTTIHARALAWLVQVESEDGGRNVTLGGSLSQSPLLALRSAVLRIDPEFKPLARASQRNNDHGRLAATYSVARVATAIAFESGMPFSLQLSPTESPVLKWMSAGNTPL